MIIMLTLTLWMPGAARQAEAASGLSDPDTFIKGVDISTLQAIEAKGMHYYEDGQEKDLLAILKDHGVNYVRLRVWNQPTESGGFNDAAKLLEIAPRVKAAGMKLLVDFHYSDFWADPGKQEKPAAWKDLGFNELKQAVYEYTAEVLTDLKDAGAYPDMVQVGNEINSGMLLPDGAVSSFDNLAALLSEGIRAVRDTTPSGGSVKIMLHLAEGGNNAKFRSFFDQAKSRNLDYDVIGMSYYPYWHGTFQELKTNMNDMVARYGKEIVVAETAYPFTLEDADPVEGGNIAKLADTEKAGFPASPANQKLVTETVLNTVAHVDEGKGLGVFYWEPAWLSGVGWKEGDVNGWENQAMFDFDGNALSSLDAFKYEPGSLAKAPIKVYASEGVTTVKGQEPDLPATASVLYNDGSITPAPVVWDAVPSGKLDAAGEFTLEGSVEGLAEKASVTVKVLANANMVRNPGFESWMDNWTLTGDQAGSVKNDTANVHAGANGFNYWYGSDYAYKLSQTVTGLENGIYTLKAWISGGGGETKLRLFADGYGGDPLYTDAVNTGWNVWKPYTVGNIAVTNGQATIGIDMAGPGGTWGWIDDFELVRMSQPAGTLTGGGMTVSPGSSFDLTFGIGGLENPFRTEEMTLRYDPQKLEFVDAASLAEGLKVVRQTVSDEGNAAYLVLAAEGGTVSNEASLLKLTFKAKAGAASGSAVVEAANIAVSDGGPLISVTGSSASVTISAAADMTALDAAIADAEAKYAATSAGAYLGGYATESRNALKDAIAAAKAVRADVTAGQAKADAAQAKLNHAVETYLSSAYTLETLGAAVTIRDLANVSAAYGKTESGADWYRFKPYDADKNGKIDIMDLAATARKIPGKF
ncbi:glycosyl hydrolase 53 family protein [Paenibacillus glufosinatiresistens]|uniref:glycosyl hydrolase 53 family protein n=1 Tax=Paenibacillus glufosinatiresistens TaxID=3070657 RepID=UPI00286EA052|nr:glycosyl hydrolase 53 family protein [Paenibacillus sp. YX.27]